MHFGGGGRAAYGRRRDESSSSRTRRARSALEREIVRSLLDTIERRLGRLEEMAGFRNVLAHEYDDGVPELVHENLGRPDDIRAFVEALLPRRDEEVLE